MTTFCPNPQVKPHELSINTITSYVEELESYKSIWEYLPSVVKTVLLWRGHYDVTFPVPWVKRQPNESVATNFLERWTKSVTVWLPLHSVTAFTWGIAVTADFNRFPSFLMFAIGWIFLATMENVRRHPSPWYRCRSYSEILFILIFGHSLGHVTIRSNENIENINKYSEEMKEHEKRKAQVDEILKTEQSQLEWELLMAEREVDQSEVDITTQDHAYFGIASVTPFKGLLKDIQQWLRNACHVLRVAKSVILWRTSYAAFWIVTASFALSFVMFWIPWFLMLDWACRIAVWVLLGPWMKLADIFIVRKWENMTEDERKAELQLTFQQRYRLMMENSMIRKISKERALKLQAMKKYMFGKV